MELRAGLVEGATRALAASVALRTAAMPMRGHDQPLSSTAPVVGTTSRCHRRRRSRVSPLRWMMDAIALTLGKLTPGSMLVEYARNVRGPPVGSSFRAPTITSLTSTGIWLGM